MLQSLPVLVMFVVSGIVGVRMLLLARRTGELPELLIGLAFSGLVFGFLPLLAASGAGRVPAGEVNLPLYIAAFASLLIGYGSSVGFVWRTFHPRSRLAATAWVAMVASLCVFQALAIHALLGAAPDLPSFTATRSQAAWIRVPFLFSSSWMMVEGLREFVMARRRLALGLSDAVVTNRFLLWGLLGVSQLSLHLVGLTLHLQGIGLMTHPIGVGVMLFGGTIASVVMVLAFWPPAAYLRLVERRSAVPA